MKLAFILSTFVIASSAFATDFYAKMVNVDCSIENGTVTRTYSFGKDTVATATETKSVKFQDLGPIVEKAIASVRDVHSPDSDYAYSMKHEGKLYALNVDDSRESMALIRMISGLCR